MTQVPGSITVDGVPIGQCGNTYGWITVVRQEATLFRDTLRNNLTLYREMEDSALVDMLRKVGLASLANRAALDAMVEDHGANFSGGEKKRICLARALLRNTEMLIWTNRSPIWMMKRRGESKRCSFPFRIERCLWCPISSAKRTLRGSML